ncbi:MAG: urease accessory protein UreE [Cyanobacteria bacterium J06623_7]
MRFNINQPNEIAQTYLGNLTEDSSLAKKVAQARATESYLETSLSRDDRPKGRIKAHSTSGISLGIIKSRDWLLRSQDVFQTDSGKLLLIHLEQQKLMVLSFTPAVVAAPTELVKLGHTLGNQHYPIEIAADKIYLQTNDLDLAEQKIKTLNIPGLTIAYEWRSLEQNLSTPSHHH